MESKLTVFKKSLWNTGFWLYYSNFENYFKYIDSIKLGAVRFYKKESFSIEKVYNGTNWLKVSNDFMLSTMNVRHRVFQRDQFICQACGLKGSKVWWESNSLNQRGHLNLYGIENNEEIIFTKDHIVPLASIKKDKNISPNNIKNLQTYCFICNQLKGSFLFDNEKVKKIREIFNIYRNPSKLRLKNL